MTQQISGAGIVAQGADVYVIDSVVKGGNGAFSVFSQPDLCESISEWDVAGGPGIVASRVFRSATTVTGGSGGVAACAFAGAPDCSFISSTVWGPPGPDISSSAVIELPDALSSSGPFELGKLWTLTWETSGPVAGLFAAAGLSAPWSFGGSWVFLDPTKAVLASVVPAGGTHSTSFFITQPTLVGLTIAFQIYDPSVGMTEPLAASLNP